MTKRVFEVRAERGCGVRMFRASAARPPTMEELVSITLGIVPELLVAKAVLSPDDASEVPVKVVAERREIARLVA